MTKLVNEFWLESIFPGIRKAMKDNNSEAIINTIIVKADLDTMTGGRFNAVYSKHHTEYRKLLAEYLFKNDKLSSSHLIKCMLKSVHEGVTVGLVQKLVNMTLKYLYSIEIFGYGDKLDLKVELENIDCPLDSTILNLLSCDYNGKHYTPWTKLESQYEYDDIQEDILKKALNLGLKSKLCYDLKYWGLPIEKH